VVEELLGLYGATLVLIAALDDVDQLAAVLRLHGGQVCLLLLDSLPLLALLARAGAGGLRAQPNRRGFLKAQIHLPRVPLH
jgi:hypothetical protein